MKWLAEAPVEPRSQQALLVLFRCVSGQRQNDLVSSRGFFAFANFASNLHAGHSRHFFIQKQHIEALLGLCLQGFPAVGKGDHLMSLLLQEVGGELANVFLILREQNAQRSGRLSPWDSLQRRRGFLQRKFAASLRRSLWTRNIQSPRNVRRIRLWFLLGRRRFLLGRRSRQTKPESRSAHGQRFATYAPAPLRHRHPAKVESQARFAAAFFPF